MRLKVVLNPRAGGGRAASEEEVARRALTEAGIQFDIELTQGPGDGVRIARVAAERGYDVVAAMGGDGTTNEVVNGIADSGATLAVIPAGSGNDFANALGIPRNDVAAACRAIVHGDRRRIDLCRVNEHYFISSFGIGFDAQVTRAANEKFKFLKGVWVYVFAVLNTIWTYRPALMRILADDCEIRLSPLLVAATNWKSYGGGMMICPEASIDDGLFEMCVVDNMPVLRFLYCFPRVMKGTHVHTMPEVRAFRASSLRIECSRPEAFHIDGEVFEAKEMVFTITHDGLEVVFGEVAR
ncbi:MAG: diacylglycerol kinase family protein [Clostridia bacterium]|nr:diacylglycerol kinase family protein [Clostridia bacterium]